MMINKTVVNIEKAPSWMVDNKFLKRGYRINLNTFSTTLKSLFMKHNELMNVWTHLIGTIVFLAILLHVSKIEPKIPTQFSEIKTSMEKYLLTSHNWVDTYKNKLKPELLSLVDTELKRNRLSANKINMVQDLLSQIHLQYKNDADLIHQKFRNGMSEKELSLVNSLSFQMYSGLDNLTSFFRFMNKNKDQLIGKNINKFNPRLKQFLNSNVINIIFEMDMTVESQAEVDKNLEQYKLGLNMYPVLVFICTAIFCLLSSSIFNPLSPSTATSFSSVAS